jgi:hypothetical protein
MSILNYTTTVSVARTLGEVTELLVKAGARQIMTEFNDDAAPSGLTFTINTAQGLRMFTLPVEMDAVERMLSGDGNSRVKKTRDQAERVAWRIMKDWLEAQLALIETEMVTVDQVLLPFMRTVDGDTFYQHYVKGVGTEPALAAG